MANQVVLCVPRKHSLIIYKLLKFHQQFSQLGVPRFVIFPRETHEPTHNNGCGRFSFKKTDWTAMPYDKRTKGWS
jgi:hypothetical protein